MKLFIKSNMLARIFLIFSGAALGALTYAFFAGFSNPSPVAFVIIVISLFTLAYMLISYRYRMSLDETVSEIAREIDRIGNSAKHAGECSPEAAPAMEAVQRLRNHLMIKDKNRADLLNMVNSTASNMEIEKLLEAVMPGLIKSTESMCGAFYIANNATNKLEIKYSLGFNNKIYKEFDISIGEGLVGEVAASGETKIIKNFPEDSVFITQTFLGKIHPKNVMLVPIINQEQLLGILALASLYNYSVDQQELVNLTKYYIGAAIGNGVIYERTKRLSSELQFQNKLIQDLNDDLEQKISERTSLLNNIMNSIDDYAIYAMDAKGVVISWNTGAEKLLGYQAEEMIGKNILVIYDQEESRAKSKKSLEIAGRDGRFHETFRRHTKDGSVYYAEVSIFARYNENGDVIGFTNVTRDITTIKTAQDELLMEKELSHRILKSSPKALAVVNQNCVVEVASKAAEELLNEKDMEGIDLSTLFEDGLNLKAFIWNRGESDFRNFKPKKNSDLVTIHANVIYDDEGNCKKAILFMESMF